MNKLNLLPGLMLLFGVSMLPPVALAVTDPTAWVTEEEMALLPELCQVKELKRGKAMYDTYIERYGADFGHMHHYCYALVFISRYHKHRLHKPTKNAILVNAMNNLNYVIKHSVPTFILLAEVYYEKGSLQRSEQRSGEAIQDFSKAIEVNPKFTRAYLALADLQAEMKQPGKSLETISEGLRHVPTSKALQRRYKELGGKEPYPEPYAAPEPKPETVEAPAPKPEDTLDPAAIRAKREADTKQPSAAPAEANAASTSATPPAPITPPRNPWCRFCAEDGAMPNTMPPSTPATEPTAAP